MSEKGMSDDIFWYDGHIDAEVREKFLAAARREPLQLVPLETNHPSGPGLVLFQAVSEALCAVLHHHSRYSPRILAVALDGKPLDGPECWRLLASGASDVVTWSADVGPQTIRARLARWREIDRIAASPAVSDRVVGESVVWQTVLRDIVEIASFSDSSVLIMGETGTGKELVAKLIHSLGRRAGNLVILDCTTIAPELSGSEFFGHERGAFTGAIAPRDGAFALADGGTLFLDEVGELPIRLQKELLRVIQEHTYKKVGGNAWFSTTFRLICATNRDLTEAVERNVFRRDLYHRLASWIIRLPTLRERRGDILPLAHHFLKEISREQEVPELDPAVRDYLIGREYPGNVRDLRNLVFRIGHRHVGPGPLTAGDIPTADRPEIGRFAGDWRDDTFTEAIRRALSSGASLEAIKSAAADTAYALALKDETGDARRAAARLGVSLRAVQARRAGQKREAGD